MADLHPEADRLAQEIELMAYKEFQDTEVYPRGFAVIPEGVEVLWETPENDLGYVRPWTYELQCASIFNTARYSVCESSTKAGKTLAAMIWIYEQAVLYGGANKNFWWVGPVSDQSDIAFRRLKEYIPKDMYVANESRKFITLWNGAVIWFKSGEKPNCYDQETEILTDAGWKLFADLSRTERVLTRNRVTGVAEWHLPYDYIEYDYTGEMRRVLNKKLDILVTPDHKFWVEHLERKHRRLAREAVMDDIDLHHEAIPATAGWVGGGDISHDEAAFMGLYLAEGCASGCSGGTSAIENGDYTITISQSIGDKGGTKGDVREKAIALIKRLGYNVNTTSDDVIYFRNKDLWKKLVGLGDVYTKRVPYEYKNLPPDKLRTLLYWMVLGDGTIRRGDTLENARVNYFSCNKGLVDDFQEMAIKAGFSAVVRQRKQSPAYILGRKIKSGDLWQASLTKSKHNHFHGPNGSYVTTQEYSGKVYCVSVENHVVMVRRNGKPCWSGNSLYGEDVYAAVVDEASRVKLESWQALRSTLTFTRGPVRIIGNVKGRANWMYKLGRIALEGEDPDFVYAKITAMDAADAGVFEWKDVWDAKKVYDDMSFRELYLAEPADDGGNPFGIQHIQACISPRISTNEPVAFGWDVAKGNNWVVGIGLDKEGNVCRFHRWRDSWDATIKKVIASTGKVPALVDSTGSGDQLLERLRDDGGKNFTGLVFSQRSKQELMIGLAVAIQNGEITYPDGPIVYELELFEYEISPQGNIKYAAPQGYHDDCVDALALAVKRWRGMHTVYTSAAPISIERTSPWKI